MALPLQEGLVEPVRVGEKTMVNACRSSDQGSLDNDFDRWDSLLSDQGEFLRGLQDTRRKRCSVQALPEDSGNGHANPIRARHGTVAIAGVRIKCGKEPLDQQTGLPGEPQLLAPAQVTQRQRGELSLCQSEQT